MILLLLLAALATGGAHDPSAHPDETAPVERLDALPAAFVGRWEPDVTACGDLAGDDPTNARR